MMTEARRGKSLAVSGALRRTDASVDGFECPLTWREVAISMEIPWLHRFPCRAITE